jgi:hypothetical protein
MSEAGSTGRKCEEGQTDWKRLRKIVHRLNIMDI